MDDVSEQVTDLAGELSFDAYEAEEVERRIDAIQALKRKYGANKQEIDAYLDKIQAEFDLLSDCEGQYQKLTAKKSVFSTVNTIFHKVLSLFR
jgi:DNA repair protein RecN (Recombination protein N)